MSGIHTSEHFSYARTNNAALGIQKINAITMLQC